MMGVGETSTMQGQELQRESRASASQECGDVELLVRQRRQYGQPHIAHSHYHGVCDRDKTVVASCSLC